MSKRSYVLLTVLVSLAIPIAGKALGLEEYRHVFGLGLLTAILFYVAGRAISRRRNQKESDNSQRL